MRRVLQAISWFALAGVVIPSLAYYSGSIELPTLKTLLLVATVVWFVVTPMWMGREEESAEEAVE